MIVLLTFMITNIQSTNVSHASPLSISFPTDRPLVFVDPPESLNKTVGEHFTVSVKVFNLTNARVRHPDVPVDYPLGNLYGLDIKLTWDPDILEYVSHTVTIPVEEHPDGVLHGPIIEIKNIPNPAEGWYWIAISSQAPAGVFNNPGRNNTIFNITFRVKKEGASALTLENVELAGFVDPRPVGVAKPILHYRRDYSRGGIFVKAGAPWDPPLRPTPRDGHFATVGAPWAEFSYWPKDYGVVGKPVIFNASGSHDPDGYIVRYEWDFGDGTITSVTHPICNHTYTKAGSYLVSLMVVDNATVRSLKQFREVKVVESRELAITGIKVHWVATQNETVTVRFTIENRGSVAERVTVSAYVNETSFSYPNYQAARWRLIWFEECTLMVGVTSGSFKWLVNVGVGLYYIKMSVTILPYENPVDNIRLSEIPVRVTLERIHDVVLTAFDVRVVGKDPVFDLFPPPAIIGETVRFTVSVYANGSVTEDFNLTIRVITPDGTLAAELLWENQNLSPGEETALPPKTIVTAGWQAGFYRSIANATIKGYDWRPENNVVEIEFKLIRPPTLIINVPEQVYKDEDVTITAVNSVHPDGEIVKYLWRVYEPDALKYGFAPTITREGREFTVVFEYAGKWDIVLEVTDNYGITYSVTRPATSVYRAQAAVDVKERTMWPVDPLFIIIIIIAIVTVASVAVWVKRRKA